jgi:hypothetical protein
MAGHFPPSGELAASLPSDAFVLLHPSRPPSANARLDKAKRLESLGRAAIAFDMAAPRQ